MDTIRVGTTRRHPQVDRDLQVLCETPVLKRHAGSPWGQAWIAERLGIPIRSPETRVGAAEVDISSLSRHMVVAGSTGSGKSRFVELLTRSLLEQGHSVVFLGPKGGEVSRALLQAHAAGVPPTAVTMVSPKSASGVPGFNPIAAGGGLVQEVGDLVSLFEQLFASSWGPRLADVMANALTVLGANGLSLWELPRMLANPEYRAGILAKRPQTGSPRAFAEARAYFLDEFDNWSKSERLSAVGPVMNKVRGVLRSDFLSAMLCAETTTLRLESLWKRRQFVGVHLDFAALGDDGARLLAGVIVSGLYRTSLRAGGPTKVCLIVDETALVERFVGRALADIATVARSRNLALICCLQTFSLLSDSMRATLLSQPAVSVFFRLGSADARQVAASLAAGTRPRIARITVEADDRAGQPHGRATWRHPVLNASGQPVAVSARAWKKLRWDDVFGYEPVKDIKGIALASGCVRLYVHDPSSTAHVELGKYVAGLSPQDYWFDGPSPLVLVIAFPRFALKGVERFEERDAAAAWESSLQELRVRQAVLRTAGSHPQLFDVDPVPDLPVTGTHRRFLARALAANGQSAAEISKTLRMRHDRVDATARPGGGDRYDHFDDGSIA